VTSTLTGACPPKRPHPALSQWERGKPSRQKLVRIRVREKAEFELVAGVSLSVALGAMVHARITGENKS